MYKFVYDFINMEKNVITGENECRRIGKIKVSVKTSMQCESTDTKDLGFVGYVCIYTYICIRMYTYTYTYICIHTHTHVYTCIQMYIHMHVYTCVYTGVCICMHVCMHVTKPRIMTAVVKCSCLDFVNLRSWYSFKIREPISTADLPPALAHSDSYCIKEVYICI